MIVPTFPNESELSEKTGRCWCGRCPAEVLQQEPAVFRLDPTACPLSDERLQAIAEAYFEHAQRALLGDTALAEGVQEARLYLQNRGFDLGNLESLPIGWLESREVLQQALLRAGFNSDEVKASRLLVDRRLAGRIVGPIRDWHNQIISFWALLPEGQHPQYLFWKSPRRNPCAFGLDLVYDSVAEGPSDLILVEDLLDALLLQSRGHLNVAAIGGRADELTSPRWQRLRDMGVRRVTLACQQNQSERTATLAALRNAFRASSSPEVYVLVPPLQAPCKPAAVTSLFGAHGRTESFLYGQTMHGYRYMALAILKKYRTEPHWTERARHSAWVEALALYESRRPEQLVDLDRHFVPPIVEELGIPLNGHRPPTPSTRAPEPQREEEIRRSRIIRWHGAHRDSGFCHLHQCGQTECFCFD